jgi:hypothetical protein
MTGNQSGHDVVSVGRPFADEAALRGRRRRRIAVLASLTLVGAAVAAAVHAAPPHRAAAAPVGPGPTSSTAPDPTRSAPTGPDPAPRSNGALFGSGSVRLAHPHGLHVPPLGAGSSPTWSPDGSRLAVLAGGWIVVTRVDTGATHRIACPACREIAWSPDGTVFAAAPVEDGSFGLVDAITGELTTISVPRVDAVLSPTWAPGSDEVAFLANAGEGRSGVYTIRDDGTDLTEVVGLLTDFPPGSSGATRAILVRWSPNGQRLAVLTATPDPPRGPPPITLYRLRVAMMAPDGSALRALVGDGVCVCAGSAPNMVWSPDGTTLALGNLHHRRATTRPDGDRREVRIRFVKGASGPLSWQPR